jgi:NADH:ubiquinone oxidoreductase subunit E
MAYVLEKNLCRDLNDHEKFALLDNVINEYERKESNLIQILHMAQAIFGFLPKNVQSYIAEQMGLPVSKVGSVVTFYTFFSTKPKGDHTISVCLGTACYVRGGKKIIEKLKETIGIDVGETTADRKFSLQVVRCMGACGLAPAVRIDDKVFKRVNPNKLQHILKQYSNGR